MAKNHTTTKNSTITTSEKVKNGFWTGPFLSIFRNSNHNSNIDPIPPVSQSSRPAARRAASSGKKDRTTHFQLAAEGQVKPRVERAGTENWTSNNGVNNECSEYINRVKNNMGNGSNHDNIERTATKVSRQDSFNDKISSFLNRERIKMRTTSSNIGDVNSISFNRRANDR